MSQELPVRFRGGHFEVADYSWSEAEETIHRSWVVHRSPGLSCGCGAWACELWTESLAVRLGLAAMTVGLVEGRDEAGCLVSSQHLALHTEAAALGPALACRKHIPDAQIAFACSQHVRALEALVDRIEKLVSARNRGTVRRGIDDFARKYRWVHLAARAADASERGRASLKKKPRGNSPPMGWKLGRHILKQVGLPEAYLPARRDEWPAGERFLRKLEPDVAQRLEGLGIDLEDDRRLRISRSGALQDRVREDQPVPLSESPLSKFWTMAMDDLAGLYAPFVRPSSTGNVGSKMASPNSLVRLTLAALVPTVHLDLSARKLWDRRAFLNS